MQLRRLTLSALIVISATAAAQNRVAADVEVKTVMDGKVTTQKSQVFCTATGDRTQVFEGNPSYYAITNLQGEFNAYFPASNEVFTDRKDDYSSKDDVFYLFLSGKSDDMGLSSFGYRLSGSVMEDGLLKRTYVPEKSGAAKGVSKVEIVLENYLPIYIGYYNEKGVLASKTYLSSYARYKGVMLPCRTTSIAYTAKKDSTVTRTLYSNIRVDGIEPMFRFRIPDNARTIKAPKTQK